MAFNTKRPVVQAIPFTSEGEEQASVVSSANTTTTPLAADASWVGGWEEVTPYSGVSVLVRSDQPSAPEGLKVEWSVDGTAADDDDVFSIPANDGRFFTFPPEGRFIRISYTNGPVAQGVLRLQTIFRYTTIKPSSHRLVSSIDDDDDAELIKAVVVGRDQAGVYRNLVVAATGRVQVETIEPSAPAGTTPVTRTLVGGFSVTDEDVYTITNGETLSLQRFQGGCESTNSSFRVDIIERTTASGDVLIATGYANGTNFEFNLDRGFVGDGDRRIVLRRVHGGGGNFHAFASWKGFE